MRSFRVGRTASLFSILLLALASAGCPQLNRQPDYMGNQHGQSAHVGGYPVAGDRGRRALEPRAAGVRSCKHYDDRIKGDSQTRRA